MLLVKNLIVIVLYNIEDVQNESKQLKEFWVCYSWRLLNFPAGNPGKINKKQTMHQLHAPSALQLHPLNKQFKHQSPVEAAIQHLTLTTWANTCRQDAAVRVKLKELMSDTDSLLQQWIPNWGRRPALSFELIELILSFTVVELLNSSYLNWSSMQCSMQ